MFQGSARDRSERYSKATDLGNEVRRWIADEPVLAYREPLTSKAQRWVRRNRSWAVSAASAVVLVAAVATISAFWIRSALVNTQNVLVDVKLARDEANRRLGQARESIDALLTGVGEGLANVPGAQKVRSQLLKKAADQYRELADEKSEDPDLRYASGLAATRLGQLRTMLGDPVGAEEILLAAEKRLAAAASDGLPKAAVNLASARLELANQLKDQGRVPEAEARYRRAIADLAATPAGRDEPETRFLLGTLRGDLAGLLGSTKRTEETESQFHVAAEDLQSAAGLGFSRALGNLAIRQNSLGVSLEKAGCASRMPKPPFERR